MTQKVMSDIATQTDVEHQAEVARVRRKVKYYERQYAFRSTVVFSEGKRGEKKTKD